MEKQKEYVKLSQNKIMKIQYEIDKKIYENEKIEKKKREREAECQEYKQKIDVFLEWLNIARNEIAIYDPNKEDDYEDVKMSMTPTDYMYSAESELTLIKNDIQQYLLDHQDEQILELVNKPIYELLILPPPTTGSLPSIYFPKRLRQLMEQGK